jgi:glycosyltransferase involved in cell wall biosynthesis
MKKIISFVIPAFNEQKNIPLLYDELLLIIEKLDAIYEYEIVFVNDGSTDRTWEMIENLCSKSTKVRWIDLSRNFGKELAITAGLESAIWDAIVTLDADRQHPVEKIPLFLEKWEQGFEIVYNRRPENPGASLMKKVSSRIFYSIFNKISEFKLEPWTTDYRLLDRNVVNAYLRFSEKNRIYRGLIDWLGFSRCVLVFDARAREHGEASYGYSMLFRLALHSLTSFSFFPLKLVGYLGLLVTAISSILAIFVIFDKLISQLYAFSNIVLIVILNTWIMGITLMALGFIALYIANIHEEVIGRPLYIVRKKLN